MKPMSKKQILEAMKCDNESHMFGYIEEGKDGKIIAHNLGNGYVTVKQVMDLCYSGKIEYLMDYELYAIRSEVEKAEKYDRDNES